MANISKIKTPDGTTYELAPKEENIKWGGNNVVGSVSPIGMSLSADHSANRIAFINGDLLSVEGSTDNGNTWTDYELSKGAKTAFCTSGQDIHIGTNSAEACTLNSKLRITLTAQNGSSPSNTVYTNPKKLLVKVLSANGLEVLVEVRTGTNYLNNGAWDKFGTYTVSGWSGWNDIPLILGTLGGGSTQTGNYWQLRLTFSVTSLYSDEQWRSNCYVSAIRIYGDNTWTTPSNMARHNHIYDYDYAQNTTFPANVTAPKFIGALQGNADTATNATSATTASKLGSSNVGSATQPIYLNGGTPTATTYTLGKSVPSDAVFTDNDTKNTAGSTDTSSKIYIIGATTQAANPQTYSQDTAYVGTDGCLYSGGNKVLTSAPVTSVAGKTGAVTLTASDVGLGNVGNFKAVSTVASQGLTSTEQANARANIGAGTSNFSGSYTDLSNKPTLGTAAAKNSTTSVTSGSNDLVTSGAVYTAIQGAAGTTYTFAEGTTNGAFKVTPSGGTAQSVPVHGVLTSHQSVTDNNPTLSWGSKSKVATIGSTEINVTMPSNPASGKQDTITGAATTVTSSNLTASRVLISNTSGKISAASGVTTTEVGYLAGLDRNVMGFYSHKSYDYDISNDNMRGISGQYEKNGSYWIKVEDWLGTMPPSGSYGTLEVMGNLQRFTVYGSNGSSTVYTRTYANSTWSDWKRIGSGVDASVSGTTLTLSSV